MDFAPSAASRSDTWPSAGLAESPENPSEPPHFKPTTSLSSGAGLRVALLASTNPAKVASIACVSIVLSRARLLLIKQQHRLREARIALRNSSSRWSLAHADSQDLRPWLQRHSDGECSRRAIRKGLVNPAGYHRSRPRGPGNGSRPRSERHARSRRLPASAVRQRAAHNAPPAISLEHCIFWAAVAELFFKGFAQCLHVAVLAEHQRESPASNFACPPVHRPDDIRRMCGPASGSHRAQSNGSGSPAAQNPSHHAAHCVY